MLILVTLFFLGISLRAHQLGRALGGGDENQVLLDWVYTPLNYIVTNYSHGAGGHHVFHTIILRMMVLFFGEENTLAIRFPAFAAGIVSLWFIYKIARQIFLSKTVAQLALLAAVVCPVHIYYSQTARGYSFVMLFSTLSIYATLKLLQSDRYVKWGLLLILSGFLSVYTQPLTVIFILGLALWILFVLLVPTLKAEFGLHLESTGKKLYQFLSIFLLMGVCSFLSYFPFMDRMIRSSKEDFNVSSVYPSAWDMIIQFIPNLFLKILPGPLIFFIPFFIAGIFFGKTCKRAYRFLPVIILLTTYLVTLITGLAWHPRSYLFNLPLFLIFLVGGIMWAGESLRYLIKSATPVNWVAYSLIVAYVALSLTEIFLHHFPSTKTFNVKEYRQNINSQTKSNDLLMVADSRLYMYSRSVYKKNLQNIIADNQLGGIKLLINDSLNIRDYKVKTPKTVLPVFWSWQDKLSSISVSKGRKIISLDGINSISLLPKDFEAITDWQLQSGAGEFALNKEHKFAGEHSLLLKASAGKDMVLRGLINQIELNQPHLVVLLWSTKKFAPDDKYFTPALGISSMVNGKKRFGQVLLGKVNAGISLYIKEKASSQNEYYWQLHSAVGWLPAGKLSLNIFLNSEKGKSIMYDSLRLFLVKKLPQPVKGTPRKADL